MNFVIILAIFLAFLLLAFPLHHLLASLSELRKGRNPLGNQLLLIGSILATLSIFLYFFATLSLILYFLLPIGCGLICYGAYWNGKRKENFHPAHHLIRIGIALVLTILLVLIQ